MLITKAILKQKFFFLPIPYHFSSLTVEEYEKIEKLIPELADKTLRNAFEQNAKYYVNKMDGLCKVMNSQTSVSIFRPRRMGKSTMINDLEFLYKNGKFLN